MYEIIMHLCRSNMGSGMNVCCSVGRNLCVFCRSVGGIGNPQEVVSTALACEFAAASRRQLLSN